MSLESAKSFMEKVKTDAAFAKQCQKAKTADEFVKKAAELGYSFTQAEFDTASQDLSDDDLLNVTGGMGTGTICKYDHLLSQVNF